MKKFMYLFKGSLLMMLLMGMVMLTANGALAQSKVKNNLERKNISNLIKVKDLSKGNVLKASKLFRVSDKIVGSLSNKKMLRTEKREVINNKKGHDKTRKLISKNGDEIFIIAKKRSSK